MSTNLRPKYDSIPSALNYSFGIVVSEWNPEITDALLEGAYNTLISKGALPNNIHVRRVPGSIELTLGAQFYAEYTDVNAIICLGCVIQGETPHFTYVCQSVTQGITELNIQYCLPVVFGVLTTLNYEQAKERAGGKLGNKGEESAIVAIKMAALQDEMEEATE
jgi:6,7-dimethyl-8-ribityllumazine synthase